MTNASGLSGMKWCQASCVLVVIVLFPAVAAADLLDQSRASSLISETVRKDSHLVPGVLIHIIDLLHYVEFDDRGGTPLVDMSTFVQRTNGDLFAPLDAPTAMRLIREVAAALFRGEMATTLHTGPGHGTICVVIPRAPPLSLVDLTSMLSGADADVRPEAKTVDTESLFRFLLFHELAHCGEHPLRYRTESWTGRETYYAESRADAFAVLMHIRLTGDDNLPRFVAHLRRAGATNRDDREHQTAATILAALASATGLGSTGRLQSRPPGDVLRLASELAWTHALDYVDYAKSE